ncbi:hypothetical protein ACJVDH_15235 [Pedobacter sp. AW1-32]|uniref:nucleotide-binding protein n=1 Tax=Pedobacter sp. AW1-32 TaxID=3383026 RepID=UPI003FF08E06
MIVFIYSLKGGSGKSTLSLLLSYSMSLKKNKVTLLSVEPATELSLLEQRSLVLDDHPEFSFLSCSIDQLSAVFSRFESSSEILIIDFPCALSAKVAEEIQRKSACILIPFDGHVFSVTKAMESALRSIRINPGSRVAFIPVEKSKVGFLYSYDLNSALSSLAYVSQPIPFSAKLTSLRSLNVGDLLTQKCLLALEELCKYVLK